MAMSKGKQLWLTVFLGLMTAMAPLATDMYLPALPTVQVDFGITASLAQMTLTMTMIGMALGQIFAGPISDRYGRKWPLTAGMVDCRLRMGAGYYGVSVFSVYFGLCGSQWHCDCQGDCP